MFNAKRFWRFLSTQESWRPFVKRGLLYCCSAHFETDTDWFWRLLKILQSVGLVRSRPSLCHKLRPRWAMAFAFVFLFRKVLRNHFCGFFAAFSLALLPCCCRISFPVAVLLSHFRCKHSPLVFLSFLLFCFRFSLALAVLLSHSSLCCSLIAHLYLCCSFTAAFLAVLPFYFGVLLAVAIENEFFRYDNSFLAFLLLLKFSFQDSLAVAVLLTFVVAYVMGRISLFSNWRCSDFSWLFMLRPLVRGRSEHHGSYWCCSNLILAVHFEVIGWAI